MYQQSFHGNLVANKNCGLLILGMPNVGKSILSYYLIQKYYFSLITDDLVLLTKSADFSIIGSLPNLNFLGWLYLKKQGFIYVTQTKKNTKITHIIYLTDNSYDNKFNVIIFDQSICVKTLNIRYKKVKECADLFIQNNIEFCITIS